MGVARGYISPLRARAQSPAAPRPNGDGGAESLQEQTPVSKHPKISFLTRCARQAARAAAAGVLTATSVLVGVGCTTTRPDTPYVELPAGSFAQAWSADLKLPAGDRVASITPVGDLLVVQTRRNTAYALSAAGGTIRWISQVAEPGRTVGTPAIAGDRVVFPALNRLIVYRTDGRREKDVELGRAIRSDAVGDGDFVYVGFDYTGQGRLGRVSLTEPYVPIRWELMTFGAISAAPAVFQDAVFVGSEDGNVYAVSDSRTPLWPLPGNVFATGAPILADVRADDTGVYVAAGDGKLYALDRATGRIRWQYFGGRSLSSAPLVTNDRVYQFVPGKGVVALDKIGGAYNREPKWVVEQGAEPLAQGARHVYMRDQSNGVLAVERATGKVAFRTARGDLRHFAAGAAEAEQVYAATDDGLILGIKPVFTGGITGQLVTVPTGPAPLGG